MVDLFEEQDMNPEQQETANEAAAAAAAGKKPHKKAAGRPPKKLTIEQRKKKNERDRLYRAARKADYNRLKLEESTTAAVTHNNELEEIPAPDARIFLPKRLQMVSLEEIILLQLEILELTLKLRAKMCFLEEPNLKHLSLTNICFTLESDGVRRFCVYENGYTDTREVNLETSHSPWESNIVINISLHMNVEHYSSRMDQIWDTLKSSSSQPLESSVLNLLFEQNRLLQKMDLLLRQTNSYEDRISVTLECSWMGRFSSKKQNCNFMAFYGNRYTEVNLETTSQLSHGPWESNMPQMNVEQCSSWGDQDQIWEDLLKTPPSPQPLDFPTDNPVYQFPPPTQQPRILEPMEVVEEASIPTAPSYYSAAPMVEGNDNVLHSSFTAPDNNMQVNDIIAGTIPWSSHSQPYCRSLADQILPMLSVADDESDISAADFGYDLGALDMMTDFAEYRIPTVLLPTATSLSPTISQSHRVTKVRKSQRTSAFILVCAAVLEIQSTSFSTMSVDAFRKWRDAIDEADSVGFNVELLRSGLMRVAKAYLGHMNESLYMTEHNIAEMSNSLTHAEEVARQSEVELHLAMQRAEDSRSNVSFIKDEISRLSSVQDRLMSLNICDEDASEECTRLRTMFETTPGHFTNWN